MTGRSSGLGFAGAAGLFGIGAESFLTLTSACELQTGFSTGQKGLAILDSDCRHGNQSGDRGPVNRIFGE